jgi:copper chaperone NosL
MTRVSKYAFLDKKMAKKFQAKYGGNIMNFTKALEVAKEDFKR